MEGDDKTGLQEATLRTRGMRDLDHDIHPEQYPEARREYQICVGALESLKTTTKELLDRINDYTRDTEPEPSKIMPDSTMPVRSPFGRELRSLSDEISALERQVRGYLNLLEL